ncbi:MAG: hypothetical protein JWO85_1210 [Candidatus Eremiobacteraeota bacterium]|nr:hypothetical protein [Candidatus Eremiobacteraeota bacterium]
MIDAQGFPKRLDAGPSTPHYTVSLDRPQYTSGTLSRANEQTPLETIAQLLGARRTSGGVYRAPCPVHGNGTKRTLRLTEAHGRAYLTCHAGCADTDVLAAIGKQVSDLFPESTREAFRGRAALPVTREPHKVTRDELAAALASELERIQDTREAQHGVRPPVTSREVNAARRTVGARFGMVLRPADPTAWEGFLPHAIDPAFPALFARGIQEVRFAQDREDAADADLSEHECFLAASWAARELRAMVRAAARDEVSDAA